MKKFTKVCNWGGVALSTVLALSLMFMSCDNPSDSDDDNPTINGGNNTSLDNNNNSNSNNNNSTDNNGDSNSNGENSGNSNDNNSNSGNNSNNSSNDDNKDNDDNKGPSPNLPENVGKNPIEQTIKLNREGDEDEDEDEDGDGDEEYSDEFYLALKADGTAIYGDDKHNEIRYKLKYAYDETKKEIYMKVEKSSYNGVFSEEESQLLTHNEILSRLNEDIDSDKLREELQERYKDNKDEEWFEETYPNCNSYDDFEAEVLKQGEFDSFADYVKSVKQNYEAMYKAYFSAQTTYGYKIENDKMTLTEKFTGVKNMFPESQCYFSIDDLMIYGGIHSSLVYYLNENGAYYTGIPNIEKKTIVFRFADGQKPEEGLKLDATYTENVGNETVTIKFKDKEYVCDFYGQKFIQK